MTGIKEDTVILNKVKVLQLLLYELVSFFCALFVSIDADESFTPPIKTVY